VTLEQEIALEQRHLDRVYARLERLREDGKANLRDAYRIADLGHKGALEQRDRMVYDFSRRLARLDTEHEGLVFGRLDRQDGSTQYVGRLGIRDADTTPLLIDWRAPAAADFYQATAADSRGVVRRRSIRSRGETVVGLDDEILGKDLLDPSATLPVVGDGALLASLGRATGRGMRDIVATIQKEQDEAIRSPARGVTVVEGGPGTGKTAVALHRVAYLLYLDRARYDAGGGILVVGPSPVFMGYIATVLPALGEHTAALRALGELVEGVRAARVDRGSLAALKGSVRMAALLRRFVREQVPGAPTELRLVWRGRPLRLDESTLERVRRRALRQGRRNQVRRAAFNGIFEALWADAGERPGGSREVFEEELADRAEFRDFLRAWWPRLRPHQVLAWLADPTLLGRVADGAFSADEVKALAASFTEEDHSVADVALLDELDHLLGRPPQPPRRRRNPYQVAPGVYEVTTIAERQAQAASEPPPGIPEYAHIVVDEAQDVSPMQWRALGRRGRFASWTVVGDPAQSAWSGDPAELARAREAALRGAGARRQRSHTYQLTTNYRNSVEIFELAASVIRPVMPDVPLPVAVRATGVDPEHRQVAPEELPAAVRVAVGELLAQVEGTIGVISVDRLTGWLDPHDRVQVVTALEAKGLEYDGVVLVEPNRLAAELGPRTLYVALSRATQRLVTIGTGRWP
jgi:hypothetical protein